MSAETYEAKRAALCAEIDRIRAEFAINYPPTYPPLDYTPSPIVEMVCNHIADWIQARADDDKEALIKELENDLQGSAHFSDFIKERVDDIFSVTENADHIKWAVINEVGMRHRSECHEFRWLFKWVKEELESLKEDD